MDQVGKEFREAACRHEIVLPICGSCAKHHWYPLPRCPHCQSADLRWKTVAPAGHLFSWTVVQHSFHPELASHIPYIVGLVELDNASGVRLVTNLVDCEPSDLRIGMRMIAQFRSPVSAEHVMPVFSPEEIRSRDDEPR